MKKESERWSVHVEGHDNASPPWQPAGDAIASANALAKAHRIEDIRFTRESDRREFTVAEFHRVRTSPQLMLWEPVRTARLLIEDSRVAVTKVDDVLRVSRCRVPGGWLVRTVDFGDADATWVASALAFVPDPAHSWDGTSGPIESRHGRLRRVARPRVGGHWEPVLTQHELEAHADRALGRERRLEGDLALGAPEERLACVLDRDRTQARGGVTGELHAERREVVGEAGGERRPVLARVEVGARASAEALPRGRGDGAARAAGRGHAGRARSESERAASMPRAA